MTNTPNPSAAGTLPVDSTEIRPPFNPGRTLEAAATKRFSGTVEDVADRLDRMARQAREVAEADFDFASTAAMVNSIMWGVANLNVGDLLCTAHELAALRAEVAALDFEEAVTTIRETLNLAPSSADVQAPRDGARAVLVGVRPDQAGVWLAWSGAGVADVTEDMYEQMHEESDRLGMPADRIRVVGGLCLLVTDDLDFYQLSHLTQPIRF